MKPFQNVMFMALSIILLLHFSGSLLFAQSYPFNDEWYRNSYRKLFFDYHNYEAEGNIASQFNAESWAEQLENAHVQAVSLHSYCSHGWRYYRKATIGYKVRMDSAPASVTQQPECIKLDWEFSGGYVSFRVPKLDIYSIVVIE